MVQFRDPQFDDAERPERDHDAERKRRIEDYEPPPPSRKAELAWLREAIAKKRAEYVVARDALVFGLRDLAHRIEMQTLPITERIIDSDMARTANDIYYNHQCELDGSESRLSEMNDAAVALHDAIMDYHDAAIGVE